MRRSLRRVPAPQTLAPDHGSLRRIGDTRSAFFAPGEQLVFCLVAACARLAAGPSVLAPPDPPRDQARRRSSSTAFRSSMLATLEVGVDLDDDLAAIDLRCSSPCSPSLDKWMGLAGDGHVRRFIWHGGRDGTLVPSGTADDLASRVFTRGDQHVGYRFVHTMWSMRLGAHGHPVELRMTCELMRGSRFVRPRISPTRFLPFQLGRALCLNHPYFPAVRQPDVEREFGAVRRPSRHVQRPVSNLRDTPAGNVQNPKPRPPSASQARDPGDIYRR